MSKTAKLAEFIEDFSKGDSEKVISLLAEKANPNAMIPDGDGDTIFQYFIASMPENNFKENERVVQEFLKTGANPLVSNDDGESLIQSLFENSSLKNEEAFSIFMRLCCHIEVNRLKLKNLSKNNIISVERSMAKRNINDDIRRICVKFLKKETRYNGLKQIVAKEDYSNRPKQRQRNSLAGRIFDKDVVDPMLVRGLFSFAKEGNSRLIDTIKRCMGRFSNIKQTNDNGDTFLHVLCENRHYDLLKDVFAKSDTVTWSTICNNVFPVRNNQGKTILHIIAEQQQDDVFRMFLSPKQMARTVFERANYPFFIWHILQKLDKNKKMPQDIIKNEKIKAQVGKILQLRHEGGGRWVRPLATLQNRGAFSGENKLIKFVKSLCSSKESPDAVDKIKNMINKEKIDVNVSDSIGNTPLFYAVQYRLTKVTMLLLRSKAKMAGVCNKRGENILHIAARHNRKFYKTASKFPNLRDLTSKKDNAGKTPEEIFNELNRSKRSDNVLNGSSLN